MTGLLSSRPLLDNRADSAFFVDRESELRHAERAVELGFNALLTGSRGSGKTSFLRRLAYRLRERGSDSVFVDGAATDSSEDLLAVLRERLFGPEIVTVPIMMKHIERLVGPREVRHRSPSGQLLSRIDALRRDFEEEERELEDEAAGDRAPRIVLLDDLPREGAHRLFGRLRDELWTVPVTWIVATHPSEAQSELGPPADAFFESRLTLKPLGSDKATELLARRVPSDNPIDASMLAAIVESTDGQPRSLVRGLRGLLVEGQSPEFVAAQRDELRRRLHALGPSALRIAEELEAVGGASASDEALLGRVGLSRSSVTRLLRQMEEEGLVSAAQEVRETSGRPRKVYRLTESPAPGPQ